MADTMLSTSDNPYNPFTQWDEWYAWDVEQGYYTCAYLARIAKTSDALSDEDQDNAISDAIAEILDLNILGVYIEVPPPNSKDSGEDSDRGEGSRESGPPSASPSS